MRRRSGGVGNDGKGHQDAFLRPRLGARYRFSQATFTGTRGNERDAPKAAGPVFQSEARLPLRVPGDPHVPSADDRQVARVPLEP